MEVGGKIFLIIIVFISTGIIASYPFLLDEISIHVLDTVDSSSKMIHNSYTLDVKHPSFHDIFIMNNLDDSIPHFLSNVIISSSAKVHR